MDVSRGHTHLDYHKALTCGQGQKSKMKIKIHTKQAQGKTAFYSGEFMYVYKWRFENTLALFRSLSDPPRARWRRQPGAPAPCACVPSGTPSAVGCTWWQVARGKHNQPVRGDEKKVQRDEKRKGNWNLIFDIWSHDFILASSDKNSKFANKINQHQRSV